MIHFHNGDVAASLARRAGVPGRHLPFRESLAGGPVRQTAGHHRAAAHRPSFDAAPKQIFIEAGTPDDAIGEFVRQNGSELVSLTKPVRGQESIATVKKNDSVFLVRVYAA